MDNRKQTEQLLRALEKVIRQPPTACGGKWTKKELEAVALEYLGGLTEQETYCKLLENRLKKYHGRMSKRRMH